MSRHAHVKRWEVRRVRRRRCRARLRGQSMLHGRAPAPPSRWPALRLLCPASLLFDPLRQPLVSRCDFLHRLPSLRVAHRLSLGKDFLGPYSPAADEQYKLSVWRNLAISAFGRCH
jgi:hypothetical protein